MCGGGIIIICGGVCAGVCVCGCVGCMGVCGCVGAGIIIIIIVIN